MNAPDRDSTTILDALATQDRALRIAMRAHEGQHRKSDHDLPYMRLQRSSTHGFSATTVAAAYLHDVLEDTAWSAEDLLAAGVEQCVLDIVHECSEAPKPLSWRERKRDLISRMRMLARVMCAAQRLEHAAAHPRARGEGRLEPPRERSEVAAVVVHLLCRGPAAPRTAPASSKRVQDLVEATQRTD